MLDCQTLFFCLFFLTTKIKAYVVSRAGKTAMAWMKTVKHSREEKGKSGTDAVIELAQNGIAVCLCQSRALAFG